MRLVAPVPLVGRVRQKPTISRGQRFSAHEVQADHTGPLVLVKVNGHRVADHVA